MKNLIRITGLFNVVFIALFSTVWADQPSVLIDLTRKTRAQVSVAVLPFQSLTRQTEEVKVGRYLRKVLENDLKIQEWFSVFAPRYHDQFRTDSNPATINYNAWEKLGVQWVVTTQFESNTKTQNALFAFRLFDAVNKRFIVGKRYRGKLFLAYRMMHRFADEMVEQLTGKRGVADTQIAYVEADKSSKEIYIIDFDGKNRQKITEDRSIALKPTWSPDGKRMVFTSYARKNPQQVRENPNLVMVDIQKNNAGQF